MTTRLLLIRHGQSVWNAARRWQGHSDAPLSALGFEQAAEVAATLAGERLDLLYSSDLKRAFATAWRIGEKTDDPVTMYLCDIYTTGVNLAGLPGMSIPAGMVDGLPVGLQLVGNYFQEARLLAAAHVFQRETDWHKHRAPAYT